MKCFGWLVFLIINLQRVQRSLEENHIVACPRQCSCEGIRTVNMYCGFLADESFKPLRHVPWKIPTKVTVLSLYNNLIANIPGDAFANLTQLRSLNLRANLLSALPRYSFRDLVALRSLNLGANRLSTLSEHAFDGLPSLQELFLDSNRIRTLPEKIFQGLPALRRLYLHNNTLKTFPEKILHGSLSMKGLWLNDNLLTRIERGTFRNLSSLAILYLSNNRITALHQDVFKGTTSLKLLSVSYNNLSSLPRGVFSSLSREAKVSLYNNPFVCDCKLGWLNHWLNTRSLIYSRHLIRCSSPNNLAGRPIFALFSSQFVCKSVEWGTWSAWTPCTVTCGVGTRISVRECEKNRSRIRSGEGDCEGDKIRWMACSHDPCPINGGWDAWTSWSECSTSCSAGNQKRFRNCASPVPKFGGKPCSGDSAELRTCNQFVDCNTFGEWTAWTPWSDCTVTCGMGKRFRIRACPDSHKCIGNTTESTFCYLGPCPIDGLWAQWSSWSECSTTCSNSSQLRTRSCSAPSPMYGGLGCSGPSTETRKCNVRQCPVNGDWTDWSSWSACSKSCSAGNRKRIRSCTNPTPKFGGETCTGNSSHVQECNLAPCYKIRGWSSWSLWTDCTKTCSLGTRMRVRNCLDKNIPKALRNCSGGVKVFEFCNVNPCPIHGGWSDWTNWTPCSTSCSIGITNRTRHCNSPSPKHGGNNCTGAANQLKVCNQMPCPVHGGWSDWTSWTPCSLTCSNGTRNRTRECNNPSPKHKGDNCTGVNYQVMECNQRPCPVHGRWSDWTNWTPCSTSCSVGVTNRSRHCNNPSPKHNGNNCVGGRYQMKVCNEKPCPIHGRWSDWTNWTPCSSSCANGTTSRTRLCNNPLPQHSGNVCSGEKFQERVCESKPCPVHGGWSDWTIWTPCSVTCSNGTRKRTRQCNNPSPKHGGNNCTGSTDQQQICQGNPCPIHGRWSDWTIWTPCSSTCSNGTRKRTRQCNNPSPKHGGSNCTGVIRQQKICQQQPCPVHGRWSDWTNWTLCSVTCSNGTRKRTRQCNNPSPKHGGNNCTGSTDQQQICQGNPCPIHGRWSDWTIWTPCSSTCSNGTRKRTRQCNNPSPKHGGSNCTGVIRQQKICQQQPCPVHGRWSDWTNWTLCSVTCSNGTRKRTRQCNKPSPKHGGNKCTGTSNEQQMCQEKPCPVHGGWSDWTNWTPCSVTCSTGTRKRTRQCNNPSPKHGGNNCTGSIDQQQICQEKPCPVHGGWSDWTNWIPCSTSCSVGVTNRTRNCNNPSPKKNGNDCIGARYEMKVCNPKPCPVHGGWSEWTSWTPCSRACSNGTQNRTRHCDNPSPKHGGNTCNGVVHQRKVCYQKPCQVIGILSPWTHWSSCSVTCSHGQRTRTRNCISKFTTQKDRVIIICTGNLTEVGGCYPGICSVNGAWSAWGRWSPCSKTCSNGTVSRNRTCSNPSPKYGGSYCHGNHTQTDRCKLMDCPVKAKWTNWRDWTSCNATCGPGMQMRYRECTRESSKVNVSECSGRHTESRQCFLTPCPIHGQWGVWSSWSTCSKSCSVGRQHRSRNCTSPSPQFGGRKCSGGGNQVRVCYKRKCPTKRGWSAWTHWSSCSVSCGTGVQVRSRSCNKEGGASACEGKSLMVRNCHLESCDILRSKVKWLPWSAWTPCSATCGRGHQMRWRFCFSLSMYRNDTGNCSAKSPFEVQSQICYRSPCNYSSVWTSWTKWQGCSKPCSVGIQRRVRYCLSQAVGIKCKGKAVQLSSCSDSGCPTKPPVTHPPLIKLGSPIPCPDPGTPVNGRRKFIDQIEYGSYYVAYFCRENYFLDGPKFRHCESNRRWSDSLPSCRAICGQSSKTTNHKRLRIYGGSAALPGAYPWQVVLEFNSFQSNTNTFHCGGTLIAEDWVVTAAHCVIYKDSDIPYHGVRVFLGVHDITRRRWDNNVQIIPSLRIVAHPRFSWRTYDSDIALIQLRWKANITSFVRPVCLPNGYQRRLVRPRTKGIMLGWGVTEFDKPATTLRQAILPVVDHSACKKAYENETWPVTANMLCAGYKHKSRDSCNRDSGGGFIFFDSRPRKRKWFLGGIISWGNPKCGIPGKYSVFTRVNHRFVKWIKKQMSAFEKSSV